MPKTYTVRGQRPFPDDMLARDGSAPATPADADTIARINAADPDDSALTATVEVTLTLPAEAEHAPASLRWRSFGWEVVAPAIYVLPEGDVEAAVPDAETMRRLRDRALTKLDADEIAALEWWAGRRLRP